MARSTLPAVVIALAVTFCGPLALAQPTPFDMSPEGPAQRPAAPEIAPPLTLPLPLPGSNRPVEPSTPSIPSAQPPADSADGDRRYLVPAEDLTLSGEFARRVWSIYLPEQQASLPATLTLGYRNAIVIAPEASKLSIYLNGRMLSEETISATDTPKVLNLQIPAGMLQAGANRIEMRVNQRHRTDCDIRSTYDLWTRIDPAQTYLSFQGKASAAPSVAETVRAIGVDSTGQTRFNIVAPALGQSAIVAPLLRLSEGLSLLAAMPNQDFVFSGTNSHAPSTGALTIGVGTASELQPIFPDLPAAAQSTGIATVVTEPRTEQNFVLISGPAWSDIQGVIEGLVAPLDRSASVRRDVISTQRWTAPDAPLLFGGERLPLSQLGVDTIEFPGRRVRTSFTIAVPADFYGNAYGEAQLLLDAAFANTVEPGSHIDVYVNGNIASTVPITSTRGGIFRHLPVKVAMRHMKPGVNTIDIEAIILTKEDAACAPGATASTQPRLAIFNTSEWLMPKFARISQNPNLAALSHTGFPYARKTEPLMLSMDRFDGETLGVASTFLGKLALMSGQPIAIELLASPNAIGERNAIFFGTISQMPPKLLTQLSLSPDIATAWRPNANAPGQGVETSQAFEQWRSRVSGGIWSGQVGSLQEWLHRNFELSSSSFQFIPRDEVPFTPSPNQSLLVAQGASPEGDASWTIVTAPTTADLRQGVSAFARQDRWDQIAGRATVFSNKTDEVQVVPAVHVDFVRTGPLTFGNYRLVLANWLSTNILLYAVLLVGFTVLFGLATASVLSRLGRNQ